MFFSSQELSPRIFTWKQCSICELSRAHRHRNWANCITNLAQVKFNTGNIYVIRHTTGLTVEQMTGLGPVAAAAAAACSRPCFLPLFIWQTPSQFGRGQKVRVGSRRTSTIIQNSHNMHYIENCNLNFCSTFFCQEMYKITSQPDAKCIFSLTILLQSFKKESNSKTFFKKESNSSLASTLFTMTWNDQTVPFSKCRRVNLLNKSSPTSFFI